MVVGSEIDVCGVFKDVVGVRGVVVDVCGG